MIINSRPIPVWINSSTPGETCWGKKNKKKKHRSQRHDLYSHASFGPAAPPCCMNLHAGADLRPSCLAQCDQSKG